MNQIPKPVRWLIAVTAATIASLAIRLYTGLDLGVGFGCACGLYFVNLWPEKCGYARTDKCTPP